MKNPSSSPKGLGRSKRQGPSPSRRPGANAASKRRGSPPRGGRRHQGSGPHSKNQTSPRGRGRPSHRRHRPLSAHQKFLREYEYLIKNHDEARKNYFEKFDKNEPQRRRKLELRFFKAVEKLREFEDGITPEQKALIESRKWVSYEEDSTYSTNHSLSSPDPTPNRWEDSMMTKTQLERESFRDDRQESVGDLEDYKKYRLEKPLSK
ncbi:MAG: hypothetical protein OXB88_10685 [Bacteriovoracales bacterium]|nr:hypothetical protein [Bacteriovoracales bacterium]